MVTHKYQVSLRVRGVFAGRYPDSTRQTGWIAEWSTLHGTLYASKKCATEAEAARLAYAFFDRQLAGEWADCTTSSASWNRKNNPNPNPK